MTVHEQLVEAARKYIGVPFRWHGRDKRGLDCCGLIIAAVKDAFGLVWEFHDYPTPIDGPFMFRKIREYAKRIDPAIAVSGDIVLAAQHDRPIHIGFLTDRGVISADLHRGIVWEDYRPMRIAAYYRVKTDG
jgi:probable lipoprotein NlpC